MSSFFSSCYVSFGFYCFRQRLFLVVVKVVVLDSLFLVVAAVSRWQLFVDDDL